MYHLCLLLCEVKDPLNFSKKCRPQPTSPSSGGELLMCLLAVTQTSLKSQASLLMLPTSLSLDCCLL